MPSRQEAEQLIASPHQAHDDPQQSEQQPLPPALRLALRYHAFPPWKRAAVRVPWPIISNAIFIAAMVAYTFAAVEWLRLDLGGGPQAGATAATASWATYDRATLAGAVLFTVEPFADFVGAWAWTILTALEQAHWEAAGQGGLGGGKAAAVARGKGGAWMTRGWVWTGYSVWTTAPSAAAMVRSDLNFWAAVFFLIVRALCCPPSALCPARAHQLELSKRVVRAQASLFYLWQASVPFLWADYCVCDDARPACASDALADAGSAGGVAPARLGYCAMSWWAAGVFVFDALIGLAAWYANRQRVELRLGRRRRVDWLGVSAALFLVGALLVSLCPRHLTPYRLFLSGGSPVLFTRL